MYLDQLLQAVIDYIMVIIHMAVALTRYRIFHNQIDPGTICLLTENSTTNMMYLSAPYPHYHYDVIIDVYLLGDWTGKKVEICLSQS